MAQSHAQLTPLDFDGVNYDGVEAIFYKIARDSNSSAFNDLAAMLQVSRRFNSFAIPQINNYWKRRTGIHFREVYDKHLHKPNPDWREIFEKEYKDQYENLTPQQKKLITALKENNLVTVKALNPTYADLVATTKDGTSIIFYAKNMAIKRHLYQSIIRPHYQARNWYVYRTPLSYWAIACDVGFKEIAFLFSHGIASTDDLFHKTEETLMHVAAQYGRVDVMQLLIVNGFVINRTNKSGETALYTAVRYKKMSAMRFLIEREIDLNIVAPDTGLGYAANIGNNEAVRLLLDKGANPTLFNSESGLQAIHNAAYFGHLDCVKIFLMHDRTLLNTRCAGGGTPLYYAAKLGKEDIVDYLLGQGADLNLAITNGMQKDKTPVMRAVDFKHWNIVLKLLNAGASFDALIDYVISQDNDEALAKLMELKSAVFTQAYKNKILLRVVTDKPLLTACLLKHQADALHKNEDDFLPVHLAAMNAHFLGVKMLVEHDAALLVTPYQHIGHPDHGKTPLVFAYEAKDHRTVSYLLKKMNDRQRFNALVFALQTNSLELAQKIIEHKPSILNLRDTQNRTPLKIAVDLNNQPAIDLCFKQNEFVEASPRVFRDIESHMEMNKHILALNKNLKSSYVPDVQLMLDTQDMLRVVNSTAAMNEKILALNTYKNTHHSISTPKFLLYNAAMAALVLGVMIACYVGSIAIAGYVGLSLTAAWLYGIAAGASGVGFGTELSVLLTNNFFTRTMQKYTDEHHAGKVADCASEMAKQKR